MAAVPVCAATAKLSAKTPAGATDGFKKGEQAFALAIGEAGGGHRKDGGKQQQRQDLIVGSR
jgi:hypothetical protein